MQKTDASFLNPYQSAYFSIRLANIFKLTWIYKYALFPFYICISIYRLFSCCADRYTLLDKAESTIYASPQVFHSPKHVHWTERFVKARFRKNVTTTYHELSRNIQWKKKQNRLKSRDTPLYLKKIHDFLCRTVITLHLRKRTL